MTRRRSLRLFALGAISLVAGCQDAEVGSVPELKKTRKEILDEANEKSLAGRKGTSKKKS
jgi:hypothetical protein